MADCKSDYRLESFDEYDDPCEMKTAFCTQVTVEQFEEQSVSATEKALMVIIPVQWVHIPFN